jgi:aminoglycoside phosphotransferase (APT) family kinase protein
MSELHTTLTDLVRARFADRDGLCVTRPLLLGGGSSQENWSFDVSWSEHGTARTLPLLLRRSPEAGVVGAARNTEFALLERLAHTELPVAHVHWHDDGARFGRPSMIVERRSGRAHRSALRDADPLGLGEAARLRLAAALCDLLAAVHHVDVDALRLHEVLQEGDSCTAAESAGVNDPARAELARWEAELDRVELEPQPALRLAARWLHDNLPTAPKRIALVHGDFRPANVLVDGGRLHALLDWELAHLGDPYDDLGWYTCSVYRGEHFLPGRWEPADFLHRYARAVGEQGIDTERLHFWQVMSSFRLAVLALTAIHNFLSGSAARPFAPADALTRRALADTGLTRAGGAM